MTRRSPLPRRPARRPAPSMSAEEFAALAGIDLDAENYRGTWTIREHSAWRRQWRWLRRQPVIVQMIVGVFAAQWFVVVAFVSWLATMAMRSH
jgi:hypothetical protein